MKIYIARHHTESAPTFHFADMCDVLDAHGFFVDGKRPRDVGFADQWEVSYSHKRAGRDELAACATLGQVLGRAVFTDDMLRPLLRVFAGITGPNGEPVLDAAEIENTPCQRIE
jgi:hypothetical protein